MGSVLYPLLLRAGRATVADGARGRADRCISCPRRRGAVSTRPTRGPLLAPTASGRTMARPCIWAAGPAPAKVATARRACQPGWGRAARRPPASPRPHSQCAGLPPPLTAVRPRRPSRISTLTTMPVRLAAGFTNPEYASQPRVREPNRRSELSQRLGSAHPRAHLPGQGTSCPFPHAQRASPSTAPPPAAVRCRRRARPAWRTRAAAGAVVGGGGGGGGMHCHMLTCMVCHHTRPQLTMSRRS